MPLEINNQALKNELNEYLSTKKRALADVRLTRRVLSEACPLIEKRLGDPKYLRNFTHKGKQAFYNDEPEGTRELRGLFATGQRAGDHMVNQFHVLSHVAAGGFGSFEIKNDKHIFSKRYGKINLFDWLWGGFGPYTGTTEPRSVPMRRTLGRRMTNYTEKPMTFYYRYAGKWFYKLKSRRGMESGLVTKFHNYIFGAVEYGIEKALENIVKSEYGGSREMNRIWDELVRS
jgi:hypothetical protein